MENKKDLASNYREGYEALSEILKGLIKETKLVNEILSDTNETLRDFARPFSEFYVEGGIERLKNYLSDDLVTEILDSTSDLIAEVSMIDEHWDAIYEALRAIMQCEE